MVKKITLQNGFKCTIDDKRLDDMELLEDLAEVDKGNILALPGVFIRILGVEQKNKLYDKIRDKKTGIVSSESAGNALQEIVEALNANDQEDTAKNS